jgi:hypothetical protein
MLTIRIIAPASPDNSYISGEGKATRDILQNNVLYNKLLLTVLPDSDTI